jgi:hypothetical protein
MKPLFCYLHYLYLLQLPSKILPRSSFISQEAVNFFPSAFGNLQNETERKEIKKENFLGMINRFMDLQI